MSIQAAALILSAILSMPSATAHSRFVQDDATYTATEIQEKIDLLRESADEVSAAQIATLEEALAVLASAARSRALAEQLAAEALQAPTLAETIRAELASMATEISTPSTTGLNLSEVEDAYAQAAAALTASRTRVAELEETSRSRAVRRAEIPTELIAAEQEGAAARESVASLAPGTDEATKVLLGARIDESQARVAALHAERDANEARRDLLRLRQDRAVRNESLAVQIESFWKAHLASQRADEGDESAVTVEAEVARIVDQYPKLTKIANEVVRQAGLRSGEDGLPLLISKAQASLGEVNGLLEDVRRRSRSSRRRIAVGGATESMGLALRRDYDWLPTSSALRSDARLVEKRLSAALLQLITIEESRSKVGDLSAASDRVLAELGVQKPSEALRASTRELLRLERQVHDSLLGDLATLTSISYTHKEAAASLAAEVRLYRTFIEQRILWVRSAASNPGPSLIQAPVAVADVAGELWKSITMRSLRSSAANQWLGLSALALILLGLLVRRRHIRRDREDMTLNVRSFRTDTYGHTVRALLDSVLLAAPLPMLAWMLGALLSNMGEDLPRALGRALGEVALIWVIVRFLGELAKDKGVGTVHFRWPGTSMTALRKELRWFEPTILLLALLTIFMGKQGSTEWSDSLGRVGFVGLMAAEAVMAYRLFHANIKLWPVTRTIERGLLRRTHRFWLFVAVALPITISSLALVGYTYTAQQFELRLRYSIGFVIVLVMANSLLLRWLWMTRRRLAVRQALEARARKASDEPERVAESGSTPIDDDAVDIPVIDAQTRQLFRMSLTLAAVIGLFFIWASVFPALRALENVQILPELAIVTAEDDIQELTRTVDSVAGAPLTVHAQDNGSAGSATQPVNSFSPAAISGAAIGSATTSDGNPASDVDAPFRLTLADIILALVILILTTAAAKNLPALLELSILQRLPLDRGARYAISTIARYLILIIGVSVISSTIGIGWSHVQWLAAALTFGLAFGLQEIFANFVSGLIILIERPIRVGDIVTVGDTEGRVTQLRMRATTILDYDRREYLVPNRDFITGNVINWSLSDPITRIVIKVGVAYGSDTELARKLLLKAADQTKLVLDDPASSAIFRAFGDSTLDFELRVFVANRDVWPEAVDRLHAHIDRLFREHGVEIAFPQRDLHIRSSVSLGSHRTGPDPAEEA